MGQPDIARLAGVLADPSRVAMLDVLFDGQAHAIGRLARRAGVTAQTASSHLARLLESRLVTVERAGRERRVRLAGPEVAELLERMATLARVPPARIADPIRIARTCYDHLAGMLGVLVTSALVDKAWLHRTSDSLEPAPPLLDWLRDHGQVVGDRKRPLSRACLDWSERVPHVAGQVGAAIATIFSDRSWIRRVRDSRAVRLTARGRTALARELGITLPGA
ncbi:MAG: helix-turn-helix transcriptional regulator [Kofleriaceae bacterium]